MASETAKLCVAILWHMHQPFYKDFGTNKYILPWVRLHAIKDYYDMAVTVEKHPKVKVTFNLVPSLLVQLEDMIAGTATDIFWDLTLMPAAKMDDETRFLILKNFFYCNWDTMIRPYARYNELLGKRGRFVSDQELRLAAKNFSEQDILDLQVWFNLAWFGYISKSTDLFLQKMIEKGRDFTEAEKKAVLDKQMEVMKLVIPKYRELFQKGQIELPTTPFYHPILPLLLNSESVRQSQPMARLPDYKIEWPEDVRAQLFLATEYFTKLFGQPPQGLWPSEGSVSDALVPYITEQNIKWIATDEEILALSLGRPVANQSGRSLSAQELYKPYKIVRDNKELALFFRDHALSDIIGFVYSKWNARDAVSDFMGHLGRIRDGLTEGRGYLVAVILDGENAWEYFSNNGFDFLNALYERLSDEPDIKTTTFSEYLRNFPVFQRVDNLYAGSWINHNFQIWMGDEEDNTAWEYLARARKIIKEISLSSKTDDADIQKKLAAAWQEIFIAEGSDWYWWYGEDHSSDNDSEFDALFRRHLVNIYHIMDLDVPDYLEVPIKGAFKAKRTTREPACTFKPVIDGRITSYYEWLSAGLYQVSGGRGTMHQMRLMIKSIYYGFDMDRLYLRVDFTEDMMKECDKNGMAFCLLIFNSDEHRLELQCLEGKHSPAMVLSKKDEKGRWVKVEELKSFAFKQILEISLPFEKIKAQRGEKLKMMVVMEKDGHEMEKWPSGGFIIVNVPTPEYEADLWCA